jgi:hypothetical protein
MAPARGELMHRVIGIRDDRTISALGLVDARVHVGGLLCYACIHPRRVGRYLQTQSALTRISTTKNSRANQARLRRLGEALVDLHLLRPLRTLGARVRSSIVQLLGPDAARVLEHDALVAVRIPARHRLERVRRAAGRVVRRDARSAARGLGGAQGGGVHVPREREGAEGLGGAGEHAGRGGRGRDRGCGESGSGDSGLQFILEREQVTS